MATISDKRELANLEFEDVRFPMPWGYVVGRWYGNRHVRPILAIHGWLDNLGTWKPLLPLLPKHIGVLCIDLPGHGRSSKLPNGIVYHVFDYIFVILRIMKQYDWPKVSLLTHSMGSMISFTLTSVCPQLVDMLISIDAIFSRYRPASFQMQLMQRSVEKYLIENERLENPTLLEPPSHTFEQLERLQYEGSRKSIELANCKHILERNVARSRIYPEKYYFSRDGRIKYYAELITTKPLAAVLARRIKTVPYCVIKGSDSDFVGDNCTEVIEILQKHNQFFEFHEIPGTHHVHVNDPARVAAIINPFINRHRPPLLESWSVDGNGVSPTNTKAKTNAGWRFWQTRQRSKL